MYHAEGGVLPLIRLCTNPVWKSSLAAVRCGVNVMVTNTKGHSGYTSPVAAEN